MTISPSQGRRSPARRVVTLLILLVVLAGLVVGGLWAVDLAAKETTREEFTLNPTGDTLSIETDNGEVTLTTSDDDVVRVTRITEAGRRDPDYAETPNGDGDRLAADCPEGFLSSVCEVDYEVAVPAGLAVRIDTSSGDIRVNGVEGTLTVNTSSGSITAEEIRSDEVTLDSSSGGISLIFADEPTTSVKIDSSSGDVRVQLPSNGSYNVNADSSSGDVNIGVNDDPNGSTPVDASTSSGNIDIVNG
ncbi:MAG TPA: DUF4097 family beta strand repeat-containing protein [Pseudonocardiaceae bacterium]